jgi:hypothetical protein
VVFRKKKWVIIGIIAAVVILVAGIVGGAVVYAQTSTPSASNPGKTFAARVATILGIDQAKVESAFAQAQKDMQNEATANRLKSLVAQGKISQQQADQYQQWWNSRPNVPAPLGPQGLQSPKGFKGGFHHPPGFGQPGTAPAPSTSSSGTQ